MRFKIGWIQKLIGQQKETGCTRKVRYRSKERAKGAVSAMKKKGIDGLEPYQCSFCQGWHVGHPQEVRVSITREDGGATAR